MSPGPKSSSRTRPLVVLTGGTGFIGQHLVRELLAAGWRLRLILRDPGKLALFPDLQQEELEVRSLDLLASEYPDDLFTDAAAIIHTAGLVAARRKSDFFAANTTVTERLAALAVVQAPTTRFIHFSSLAAREPKLSAYARSKHHSEEVIKRVLANKNPWTILRPPAVYGPGDAQTLLLYSYLGKGFLPIPRDKTARFSLIHVHDLARFVVCALQENAFPAGHSLEIDDRKPGGYSWQDIQEAAEAALKRKIRLIPLPKSVLVAYAACLEARGKISGKPVFLNRGKIAEMHHSDWTCRQFAPQIVDLWMPKIPIHEGLMETFSWCAQQTSR